MRRLIINADDFGLTPGVNRAIVEGHAHGVITSASLMANGPAFEEAAQLARSLPRLSVGCHVVLVDASPLLANSTSKSNTPFSNTLGVFAYRAMTKRLDQRQLEAQATAQIRKLQSAGISVSHCDTHKHAHILPAVLQALLHAAKNCGVRALRNPFALLPLPSALLFARPGLWKRYMQVNWLRRFADQFRNAVKDASLFTPDGTLGIVVTGALDQKLFQAIVENMPEGTWEFVCHPGYNDADLRAVRTRLRESREKELRVLTSDEARQILLRQEVELVTFRDLARSTYQGQT